MIKKFKDKKQLRYDGYDYSQAGCYFVTICTREKENFFGEVLSGIMILSEIGLVADKLWREVPEHFPFVSLYEYIVMPNHVHGIIEINDNGRNAPRRITTANDHVEFFGRNAPRRIPTVNDNLESFGRNAPRRVPTGIGPLVKNSLSSIINHYKGSVTKNTKNNNLNFAWQSRFYDRIIRNEKEFNNIRQYIIDNPFKWDMEKHPDNLYY